MSLRFSLRDLLILIAVICIACAALANTGIWWHSIIATATLTGMTGLVIWGTLNFGSRRAFACGWLLFAAAYLALVFGPWTSNNLGASLITTKGLAQLELKALDNNPSRPVLDFRGDPFSDSDGDGSIDLNVVAPGSYRYGPYVSNNLRSYLSSGSANFLGRNRVTNYTTFQSTGHWLLASVFGYCGGHLAAFLFLLRRESVKP